MPSTFTYVPSYSTLIDTEFRVRETQLGNGYVSSVKDGINNEVSTFQLVFDKITDADLAAIVAFIRATNGSDYFLWTPNLPGYSSELKFKCNRLNVEPIQYNSNRLTCAFKQCFDP